MASMASWKKSSNELVEAFAKALPADPRVERRKMFGYPCAFVGGNMFAGLHEEHLIVRLDEAERSKLRALPGASVFEPMKGRPMAAYTVVPAAMHAQPAQLRTWVARALEYVAALPPKDAKKTAAKKAPAKKKVVAKKKAAAKPSR